MTREEAISQLKITSWAQRHQDNSYLADALDMAIEALEQESILDKIRAEINKALSAETISDNNQQISDVGIGLELALSIIDKYKAESEEKI